ncbi:hypothetical protein Hanom_Chr12g01148871 [Helianthus anomalus]
MYKRTLNKASSLFLMRMYSCFTCCRHRKHLQPPHANKIRIQLLIVLVYLIL